MRLELRLMIVVNCTGLGSSPAIELMLRRMVLISGLASLTLRIEMLPPDSLMRFYSLAIAM